MADLKRYREYGDELERRLRSKTFPLAIKLLKREKDIPEGAQKPLKDFGHHFSLCQVFQMSRREGRIMAMGKEESLVFRAGGGIRFGRSPGLFYARS